MASRHSASSDRLVALRTALAVGYVALAVGVLAANAHHPDGYELSIYAGTPTAFWAGAGLALAIALPVAVAVRSGWTRTAALGLGGMAIAAIAGLPVLRNYYFHGTADALTHLGWVRDISTGVLSPSGLFYPGIHSVTVLVDTVTGVGLERSLVISVAALSLVAIVFVPLAVRTVASDRLAVVVGAFAAFMLFFVNNLGVYLHAHSFAQATFFSALVLFLAFAYLTRGAGWAFGISLAVVTVAVVLYHPQQAANLILVFFGISLVQLFYRRYRSDHPVAGHRALYAHTGLLFVAFWAWVLRFEGWAFTNLQRVESALFRYLSGNPPEAGGSLQTQAGSLTAIGSGLPEIFVKLFLVAAVFSLLAGGLMLASFLGRADRSRPTANAVAIYVAVGTLALMPLIVAYFAGNIAEHYFRHLGFVFLLVTIVGALALSRGVGSLADRFDRRVVGVVVVLFLALLLPLSLATAYPSPWMHKQTQHVTEPHMDGHETVFDVNDESLELAGVRRGPWRYSDAIHGEADSRRYAGVVSEANLTRLPEYFTDGGYLLTTEYDHRREVEAYQELRYSDAALRSVAAQPGVNRVVANGALELYHVPEDSE